MIAEATPLGGLAGTKDGAHTWDSWFRPFFDYIEKNDVRVVCFIPVDWESIKTYRGKGWRDTRMQAVPAIRRRWLAEVGQAKYLKVSEGLFETLGYRRAAIPSGRSAIMNGPLKRAGLKGGDIRLTSIASVSR